MFKNPSPISRFPRRPLAGLVLMTVLPLIGCASIGSNELRDEIRSYSSTARYRVHTHFINSPLDVPQVGRLGSVAAFFRGSGLKNTRYHLTTSGNLLATQIRQTRSEDPHARIALVGWSGASLWVWDALNHLSDTGEKVDLIVYLDSNWIKQRVAERGHPNNLARALLIYRINNPPVTKVPNSTVTIIPTMNHLAVAAHPVSVRTIGRALIDLLLDQPNLSR